MEPISGILGAITAIGIICGAIFGMYKLVSWQLRKTPQEKAEDIAVQIKKEKEDFEKTGRPQ